MAGVQCEFAGPPPAVPKVFSRSSLQSVSTIKDVLEFGAHSPLTESLDSCQTSAIDVSDHGACCVYPIESSRSDNSTSFMFGDCRHINGGLDRFPEDSYISINCTPSYQNLHEKGIGLFEQRNVPTPNRNLGSLQVPFGELPSPSRQLLQDKAQKSRNSSAPNSPGIPPNYQGLPRNGCYRDLFKQVSKIGPGQPLSEKVVPDDLTVERLVLKVVALKRDEPTMPVIEPGLPYMDGRAMAYLLKDIAHRDKVDRAVEIFEWLRRQTGQYSQLCDVYVYTTGIKLCGMKQTLGHAICLVAEMKTREIPCNIHTLSALMNTCIKCAQYNVALDVFHKIQADINWELPTAQEMGCVANVVTYNTLVDLYGKLGKWREAVGVIDQVWASGLKPEVRTYNTAIIAANVCNQPQEALKVYQRMLSDGFDPIDTTYTALISAHGKNGDLDSALRTYEEMMRKGLKCNIITYGSLIQAAEQRGKWETALWFSDRMEKDKIAPNTMTFNALLSACAQGAESERAEGLFNAMNNRRLKPDAGAFSALILAHVRAGHWKAALQAWDSMHLSSVKGDPSLYASLIQCLWDSGSLLAEAHATKLFTQGCRSETVPKCIKQFHAQNGSLQVRLVAPNSCIAILSLHKLLTEVQKKATTENNPLGSDTVELVIESPLPGDAHGTQIQLEIQEAVETMLAGLGSPFSRTSTMTGHMLVAEASSLTTWLAREDSRACLSAFVPLLPPDVNTRPTSVHQTSAAEEAALRRSMMYEYHQFCQVEMLQQEVSMQAFPKYGGIRQDCLTVAKLLACNCRLGLDVAYAAMIHLDSALHAGICLQEQSHLLVAASIFQVASTRLTDLRDVTILCHELAAAVRAPSGKGKVLCDTIGTFIAINNQFQRVGLSRGVEHVTPTGALNMYLTYLRAQGAENSWTNNKDHQQVSSVWHTSAQKLLDLVMMDANSLQIRPSIMAAAALATARRLQGRTPVWPASLQFWTNIPASNGREFDLAMHKVSEITGAIACARK